MAAIAYGASASLNQYPVNYQLMRGVLSAAKSVAPFLVGSMPGQLIKNQGTNSVIWERIENLSEATTALTELSTDALPTRAGVVPSITQITKAMAKYGNVIRLSEELDLLSVNARAAKFLTPIGENAGRSLNGVMRDMMDSETTDRFGGGVASQGATITAISANDIKNVVNTLNRNDAMKFMAEGNGSRNIGTSPIRSSYMGICHSDVEEDIRSLPSFIPVEQYGGYANTEVGEFGAVGGVRWVSTSTAKINADSGGTAVTNGLRYTTASSSCDLYTSIIFGREAVGSVGLGENHTKEIYKTGDRMAAVEIIQKGLGSAGTADALNEVATVGWKGWFAGVILNGNWFQKVETGATAL